MTKQGTRNVGQVISKRFKQKMDNFNIKFKKNIIWGI